MIFVNHKSIDNEIVEINNNFTNILKRNLERKSFKENWLWEKEKQNSSKKLLKYIPKWIKIYLAFQNFSKIFPLQNKFLANFPIEGSFA